MPCRSIQACTERKSASVRYTRNADSNALSRDSNPARLAYAVEHDFVDSAADKRTCNLRLTVASRTTHAEHDTSVLFQSCWDCRAGHENPTQDDRACRSWQ